MLILVAHSIVFRANIRCFSALLFWCSSNAHLLGKDAGHLEIPIISNEGRHEPKFGFMVVYVRQTLTNRPKLANFDLGGRVNCNFTKAESPVRFRWNLEYAYFIESEFCSVWVC